LLARFAGDLPGKRSWSVKSMRRLVVLLLLPGSWWAGAAGWSPGRGVRDGDEGSWREARGVRPPALESLPGLLSRASIVIFGTAEKVLKVLIMVSSGPASSSLSSWYSSSYAWPSSMTLSSSSNTWIAFRSPSFSLNASSSVISRGWVGIGVWLAGRGVSSGLLTLTGNRRSGEISRRGLDMSRPDRDSVAERILSGDSSAPERTRECLFLDGDALMMFSWPTGRVSLSVVTKGELSAQSSPPGADPGVVLLLYILTS
jgi:hypothetical protein